MPPVWRGFFFSILGFEFHLLRQIALIFIELFRVPQLTPKFTPKPA